MGGGQTTPTPESMASVLQSYSKYLPGVIQTTAAEQPYVAGQQLAATQATQPQYNQLNLEQAQQYAVPLAQVGQDVQRSNALAGQETLNQELGAGGQKTAMEADAVSRAANPNYYKVQDASSQKAADLVNSYNLNGLSAGESNAVERSMNQGNAASGNLGLNNPTNTVSNAMNFGGAYDAKRAALGSALGAANQTATSAQNTGFNPVNLAIGQPNAGTMSNFGTGTFSNTGANTQNSSGSNTFGFGSNMMNNMSSMNNANVAAAASQNNANSGAAYLGAVCCFIFLEAYLGKLPKFIRKSRDKYYALEPDIATGYRRMAAWLVPAMQKSSIVREIVWFLMISPITNYLAYTNRATTKKSKPYVTHFWLRVWAILGRGHEESEYHKPWMYPMVKGA